MLLTTVERVGSVCRGSVLFACLWSRSWLVQCMLGRLRATCWTCLQSLACCHVSWLASQPRVTRWSQGGVKVESRRSEDGVIPGNGHSTVSAPKAAARYRRSAWQACWLVGKHADWFWHGCYKTSDNSRPSESRPSNNRGQVQGALPKAKASCPEGCDCVALIATTKEYKTARP